MKKAYIGLKPAMFLLLSFCMMIYGCSSKTTSFEPEVAAGVYIDSGYVIYRWEEGPNLMIWHDGINSLDCASSTDEQNYVLNCDATSTKDSHFKWRLETRNEQTVLFSINGAPYLLSEGSLFIITSSGEDTKTEQLKRDLSQVVANSENVTAFGLADPDVLNFIQNQEGQT